MGQVTVAGSYIVALVMDVDRLPLEGETVVWRNYHTTHGGKGSNMAACAARLGAETTFLGKIGRDRFGDIGRVQPDEAARHADTIFIGPGASFGAFTGVAFTALRLPSAVTRRTNAPGSARKVGTPTSS